LDAVLADIEQRGGVDGYWVLGDIAALGFDPVGVVERLQAIENVQCVIGNADYYVISGNYPPPISADLPTNPDLIPQYTEVQRSFAWTCGALASSGYIDWFDQLSLEIELTLPDGTQTLGVHASPGEFDGPGFRMDYTSAEMHARANATSADLIIVGHVHLPFNEQIGDTHVVVTGGIGNQFEFDLRAKYVILTADETGYATTHYYVAYDYEQAVEAIIASRHASADYLLRFARGHFRTKVQDSFSTAQIRARFPSAGQRYGTL
jgi:predicted phosphodiesterase